MARDMSRDRKLFDELLGLRTQVHVEAQELCARWKRHIRRPGFDYSAFNLACYLALRRRDIRDLQQALIPRGLSSLGRCEAHVLANLDAVISTLAIMCAGKEHCPDQPSLKHFVRGRRIIERNASRLFGMPRKQRQTRVMVTLSAEAQDYRWVQDLLLKGADCVRINCAHDSKPEWDIMIRNVHRAARQMGRSCPVLMDLTGPRARTAQVRHPSPERRVCKGDHILLRQEPAFKRQKVPFQAVCSMPEVVSQLRVGATVMFNDGKIGTRVVGQEDDFLDLEVFQARAKGERFRSDMGLNFPDTFLRVEPLTPKDVVDLDFVCRRADMVGYSFVQEPLDMDRILDEIDRRRTERRGREPLAVIAKIETARAVRNLPELIVRGAGRVPFGVMIARGDLAVEIGYLRVAEIQEEILWICEAAHAPVIWATQVLENLAKKGFPSRAEITDAAMSERSDCVMLNKGCFILDAVAILDQVLIRMETHQQKKRATLRALHSWDHLWPAASSRTRSLGVAAQQSVQKGRRPNR